ncbi:MAG: Sulfoxide reductase heme-binding subunit YedZ [Candidatus Doudnabacteria bacterium]|nr:Sulfoxide reductase heme-binding subunit YedZ [Candidatus Doudnabacteria bacterium]
MNKLLKYIRYIIIIFSVVLAIVIKILVQRSLPLESLSDIRLGEIYALVTLIYLYLTLLVSPLYFNFPQTPFRALYVKARRSLGVSVFLFAALHSYYEFFKLLGGLSGLQFLSGKYLFATILGIIDITVLALLASTSFNYAVKKLGKKWKMLHRMVYLAGIFIIIHALILGTHFINLSNAIPTIFFIALIVLMVLEAFRFGKYISGHFPKLSEQTASYLTATIFLAAIIYLYLYVGSGIAGHHIH